MRRKNIGNLVIVALVLLNFVVWTVFPPENVGRAHFLRQYAGEVLGSTAIILMACGLFLSTRAKWAEPYFGGLDKMYATHRQVNTSAFLILFIHLLTVPITTDQLLPGTPLAMIAFLGIVTLVLITLSPRIPILSKLTNASYDKWRKLHRFIGIFYALGFLHSLLVHPLSALVAFSYVQFIFIIGLVSYLYTEFFSRFLKKSLAYRVSAIQRLNGTTLEVTLQPLKEKLKHQAGQFLFVRFQGGGELDESHPFTISSAPDEAAIRLTIKACGDFTRALYRDLRQETTALLDGGHGQFQQADDPGAKQIWVAGGIGVTPFLSFIRQGKLDQEIDFYYTVRSREDALFVDEIELAEKQNSKLRAFVRFSAEHGSLSVDDILRNVGGDLRDRQIYMCGPFGMIQSFAQKFKGLGVPEANIHYEEFNFRG